MPSKLAHLRVCDVTPTQGFRRLSRTFCCFDREEVAQYFREFPVAATALMYAVPRLRELFPDAQLILDVTPNHKGHKKLHIVVRTRRWGREISTFVEDFDAWWFDEVCNTLDGICLTEEEEVHPPPLTRSHAAQKRMRALALALS